MQAWSLPPCLLNGQTDLRLKDLFIPWTVQAHQSGREELGPLRPLHRESMMLFVLLWYEAPLATRAPAHDLAFYRSLVNYMDKEIAREASKAFGRHIWYISEELVSLALFDERTTLEDKRLIVAAFDRDGAEDPPKRISLDPDPTVLAKNAWSKITTDKKLRDKLGTDQQSA